MMRFGGVALFLAAVAAQAQLSPESLKEFVPQGYKVEKTISCGLKSREYLVALDDADDAGIKSKPVVLLLVAAGKKIAVEDRVFPQKDKDGFPNYFDGMTIENVDGVALLLFRSISSGGGSGFQTYFDFYKIENKKLRLVKSFERGRMQRSYFAVYKNAVYDADVVCKRGEKHGKAFVYTCYLLVTKFTYDGTAFHPAGSERLHEQQGNRFLEDKYRNMSVLKALQRGEIFAQKP